jgi:hypothetical protein
MNTKAGELDGAAAEHAPTPPTLVGEFTSSSKRTILQYYSYAAPGPFRGVLPVPAGFNQVEVLLAGCSLATDSREAPVNRARVYVAARFVIAESGSSAPAWSATVIPRALAPNRARSRRLPPIHRWRAADAGHRTPRSRSPSWTCSAWHSSAPPSGGRDDPASQR